MAKKYYKTVFTLVILGDRPVRSIEDAVHNMVAGDLSGLYEVEIDEVSKEQMADLLEDQGSDPEYLLGDFNEEGE